MKFTDAMKEFGSNNDEHDFLLQHKYLSAIGLLTRGLTHEYNNVFAGISGQFAVLLQKQHEGLVELSEKRKILFEELLQRGVQRTDVLFEFVRDGRNEEKTYAPVILAEKALALLNGASRLHQFELVKGRELPKIRVRQRDIILSLFYLGENAIEAMAQGGKVFLELDCDEELDQVYFTMIDSGGGFDEKVLDTVFAPFTTTKRERQNYGLGLYAAKSLVSAHGGSIAIEQRVTGGARVTLKLPVEVASDSEQIVEDAAHKASGSDEGREKQVFLVVDDEEAMRNMLLHRLQRHGHMVFCVSSTEEAQEEFVLLGDIISVVLMDVRLQDGDGCVCAQKIRDMNRRVKIVLMSGQEIDSLDLPYKCLKKPFSISELEEAINDDTL